MSESSYKPGIHKFLDDFIKHYMTKKDFRESLVVSLATIYMAKCEGVPNPLDGAKVLNFFLSLCAGGRKASFDFFLVIYVRCPCVTRRCSVQDGAQSCLLDLIGMIV